MTMLLLLNILNHVATGFTLAVTGWHFFFQAPLQFRIMGKEKFVPIMMALTRLWVQTVFVTSTLVLLTSAVHISQTPATSLVYSLDSLAVVVGWLAMAINRFVIVSKALQAGASSMKDRKGDQSRDVKEFAVRGGGNDTGSSNVKRLHQTVVVFVLIMVIGFSLHWIAMIID